MKKRQPGIDLVRCLGLLLVVSVHFFLYNGFYYEPQTHIRMLLPNAARWLFLSCNGVFMFLTGYLKCTKPLDRGYYRSLAPILTGYFLTCVVSFPIRHFFLNEPMTFFGWIENMITFGNYSWYVEMYIGLFLFAPVINLAMSALKTPKQLYWLAGTMVFLTALPSITGLNLIPDYWSSLYPITYYVLGAVIRKLQPQVKPLTCIAGALLTALGLGAFTLITTDDGFSNGFSQGYGGFWITLIVVLLFLGLYKLNLGPRMSKVLTWASGGVFEGYILSRLLDIWVYAKFPQWHTPEKYLLGYFLITIPIYLISLLAGKAVHTLAVKLVDFIAAPRKEAAV